MLTNHILPKENTWDVIAKNRIFRYNPTTSIQETGEILFKICKAHCPSSTMKIETINKTKVYIANLGFLLHRCSSSEYPPPHPPQYEIRLGMSRISTSWNWNSCLNSSWYINMVRAGSGLIQIHIENKVTTISEWYLMMLIKVIRNKISTSTSYRCCRAVLG